MSGDENRPTDPTDTTESVFALAFPKGDDSFPMLKAFQEFLDAERERARRRQLTLTIWFLSAIVVLVVLFCVIGAILFSGMIRRNDTQQTLMLDFLMQRMPAPVAEAPATVQPQPVAAQPDPQVSELLEVIKKLQAQNVEMMAALQERIREPEPEAKSAVAPAAAPEEPPVDAFMERARRTGIYSSPRRKPAPPPEPEPAKPEPATEKKTDEAVAPVESAATSKATDTADAAEVAEAESQTEAAEIPDAAAGPVKVKIVRTRDMQAPEGYTPEQISIVSSGNVKFPWRVLMPDGTKAEEAK
ncbi:MAG: hypothetical protein ACOX9C_03635 [Kiritimatiellia bacterium]|jgi:hypothetical protein